MYVAISGCSAATKSVEAQYPAEQNQPKFKEGWSEDGESYAQCFAGFGRSQMNLAGELAEVKMGNLVGFETCGGPDSEFRVLNIALGDAYKHYYFLEEGLCILYDGEGFSKDRVKVSCY